MLSTDRQTDRQTNQRYQKHNLLCQGGKKISNFDGAGTTSCFRCTRTNLMQDHSDEWSMQWRWFLKPLAPTF